MIVKNMKDQDSYWFTHLFVKENVYDLHYWREQKEKKIVMIVKNMKDQDSYLFTLGVHLIVKENDT